MNLRENSEVFISEFSVLGIVQNGKLGVENLGKLILRGFRVFRELRVFDLALTSPLHQAFRSCGARPWGLCHLTHASYWCYLFSKYFGAKTQPLLSAESAHAILFECAVQRITFLESSWVFTMSASVSETMDYISLLKNIEEENSQKNENHQRASQRAYMVHTLELE